ncbi:MAG: DNA polymerase I [Spirochaetia bacterium]|nr:DNA polymerase I [Spirochaetia bacterium]
MASEEKKRKFVIIDGHAMAYRAHYALISHRLTNSRNEPVEAVYGFFRMTAKLIKDLSPDYFTITFDPVESSFRYDIYPEYKQNRKETPPELKLQMDEIKSIAQELNIPVLIKEGFEADDIMASIATQFKNADIEVILVSGDKDLFSILGSNASLYRPIKGVSEFKIFTPDDVFAELGVHCGQITDYMALTGDSSDNIPGVAGVGPKSASKLIQDFQSLENIYQHIEEIKPDGLKNKLIQSRDNAFLSKELVTLKSDIQLDFTLDDFSWFDGQNISDKITIFREKELPSLYEEWKTILPDGSNKSKIEKSSTAAGINQNISIITTLAQWEKMEAEIHNVEILSVDTETTSVHPLQAQLVGISLAWKTKNIYKSLYVPVVFDSVNERHFDYQNILDGKETIQWLKPILESNGIKKIGQNIKYDYLVLGNHGIDLKNIFCDTMVISYMLDPNYRRHNLDDMSWRYLQHETIKYKDITGTGKNAKALTEIPLESLARYAAEDAEVAYRLFEVLHEKLEKDQLLDLYRQIDGPMIELLATMEKNGILVDLKYMSLLEKDFMAKLHTIESEIYEMAEEKFNIQSTKELQNILFGKLNIASKKKTAGGGNLSTDAGVLETIKDQHPVIEKILEFRMLSKLLNTYISALPKYIHPETGRIHTSFSQTIAATGRLASSDPNLQNIPVKEEEGRAIRRAFIAPEGYELLSLDYSQIELRILAHYSEDENLILAYKNNEDIHDQAAYLLFKHQFNAIENSWNHNPVMDISSTSGIDMSILNKMKQTPEFRQKRAQAKILNFSIVYGVTEYGLSKNLSISYEEAKNLIALYFINYPGIKKYMDHTIEQIRESKISTNYFGRKRKIEDILSKNRFSREAAERLAINNPIQSTAADLIKIAMLRIQKHLEKEKLLSRLLLQIHDELLLEVPIEEKNDVYDLIKREMETVVEFKVPLQVSGGFGKNWGEVK